MTREEIRQLAQVDLELGDSPLALAYRSHCQALRQLLDALEPKSMRSAPKDGTPFLAYSVDLKGCELPPFFSVCAWHENAGFCTDEIREPIFWWPLPEVTEKGRSNGPVND